MEEFVKVGDTRIFYQVEGKGDPMILIHANGLSHGQWTHNLGSLSSHYKVYAPDLPGFGRSDKPDADYSISYYVDVLRAFMDALDIPASIIVGHSFGGAIAARLTVRYPEAVRKLILSDSTGISPGNSPQSGQLLKLFSGLIARSRKLYCRPMFFNAAASSLLDETLLVSDDIETRNAFLKNCAEIFRKDPGFINSLGSIKIPTLIIWGKNDMLLPASDALVFHELIDNSSVRVVDRCGHLPNVEKAAEFNFAVLDFLAGTTH